MTPKSCFIFFSLIFFLSGCICLKSGLKDLSAYPLIPNPFKNAAELKPFSIQMKTVLKVKKESFSMIQILSADPAKGFYHCQMMTPFGVKCLEFTNEAGKLTCLYIFPAMEKLNRKNRLVHLLSEALEKIFNPREAEEAVFRETPEGRIGTRINGKNTLYLKADPASADILEKKYFIRGQNVVNISFFNDSQSDASPFSGTVRYSHLKSGLEINLKRIPIQYD